LESAKLWKYKKEHVARTSGYDCVHITSSQVQSGSTGSKAGVGSSTLEVLVLKVVGITVTPRSTTLGPDPATVGSKDAVGSILSVRDSTDLPQPIAVGLAGAGGGGNVQIDEIGPGGRPKIRGLPRSFAVGSAAEDSTEIVSASGVDSKGVLADARSPADDPVNAGWSGSLASAEILGSSRSMFDGSITADSVGTAEPKPRGIGASGPAVVGSTAIASEVAAASVRLTVRDSSKSSIDVAVSDKINSPGADMEASVDVPRGGAGHG